MRCLACNKLLNDREATRKYSTSGTFIDLCDHCFSFVSDDIPDVDEPDDIGDDFNGDDERDGLSFHEQYFGGSDNGARDE